MSGGQARRVGVARALALKPDLLIADEPTAGLDVSVQGGILNLLSRLQADLGLAILVITHNLGVVRHVAHRMAIMYLGRLVEVGETAQLFANPRHPYTAALLSAEPGAERVAARQRIELTGDIPGPQSRPSGCEFHTRCPRMQERCRMEFPGPTKSPLDGTVHCHFPEN